MTDNILSAIFKTIGPRIVTLLSRNTENAMKKYEHKHRTIAPGTPYLFAEATESDDLINAASGTTPGGLHYDFCVTGLSLFSTNQTHGIYTVELPFNSGVHLIGIPKTENHGDITTVRGFEPVELEGVYNQVFSLYAEPNEQIQSRFVLNPSAMELTLDFCRQFSWEILNDSLYFADTQNMPSFAVIDEFAAKIRPAIEMQGNMGRNAYSMSYTNMSGRGVFVPHLQRSTDTKRCLVSLSKQTWLPCDWQAAHSAHKTHRAYCRYGWSARAARNTHLPVLP